MGSSAAQVTTVVLVRHGECKGNKEGLFRGHKDFPLNEAGLRQAAAVARELRAFDFAHIYTSPLLRARATAERVAQEGNAPLSVHQGFQNITLGPWDGVSKEEVRKNYPEEWNLWMEDPEKLSLPGAENMRDLQNRSFAALEEVVARHEGSTIGVVTHRTLLKPLLAKCLGIQAPYFWRLHVDTASYSVLRREKDRGYCCTLLNQTHHLESCVSEWN